MIKIKCWTEKDLVDDLFDSDEILTKSKQEVNVDLDEDEPIRAVFVC